MESTERKNQVNNNEPAMLNCPWCGETPQVDEWEWGGVSVNCRHKTCRPRPNTGWYESLEEAIVVWNTRRG